MMGVWRYSWGAVKLFCSLPVWLCANTCNALWLTIFCASALFHCTYNINHVSEIKSYYYNIVLSKAPLRAAVKLKKWSGLPACYRLNFMCCYLCLPNFQYFLKFWVMNRLPVMESQDLVSVSRLIFASLGIEGFRSRSWRLQVSKLWILQRNGLIKFL